MPIIGLTDRQSVTPKFPTLGKLRKGGEKQQGKFGPDLDYFRFTSDRPGVAEKFTEIYGEPAFLRMYLPFATPDENFATWKEEWGTGRTLKHRCDGVHVTVECKNGKYQSYDTLPPEKRPACPGGCKEVGRLTLILPELWKQGHIGYVSLETHGKHDLNNMMASLVEAYENRKAHGLDLRGMELTLRRQMTTISAPMNGKRGELQKSLIQIEPSVNWARLQIATSEKEELLALEALNAPHAAEPEYPFEDDDDPDVIELPPSAIQSAPAKPANGNGHKPQPPATITDGVLSGNALKKAVAEVTKGTPLFQEFLAAQKDEGALLALYHKATSPAEVTAETLAAVDGETVEVV